MGLGFRIQILTDTNLVYLEQQAIAEDWEKLADLWTASDVGLVAEVDCTAESTQELCAEIEGFPTLQFGDPSALDEYQGDRGYEELAAFAKENLVPMCGLKSLSLCDDATKQEIKKYQSMGHNQLTALVGGVDAKIEELENAASDKIVKLEAQINEIIEQYNIESQKLKADANYKYMISVMGVLEDGGTFAGNEEL